MSQRNSLSAEIYNLAASRYHELFEYSALSLIVTIIAFIPAAITDNSSSKVFRGINNFSKGMAKFYLGISITCACSGLLFKYSTRRKEDI